MKACIHTFTHPNRATHCSLCTSLCTGELNAIRKQNTFSAVISTEGRVVGLCWAKLSPTGPEIGLTSELSVVGASMSITTGYHGPSANLLCPGVCAGLYLFGLTQISDEVSREPLSTAILCTRVPECDPKGSMAFLQTQSRCPHMLGARRI